MSNLIKRAIFGVIILCILLVVIVKIMGAFKSLNGQLAKKQYFTKALLPNDSSLFKGRAWPSLKVTQVFHLEDEAPLSFLSYKEAFDLLLYKFDIKGSSDMSKILLFENKSASMATGVDYYTFPLSDFLTYKFKPGLTGGVSQLHLTLFGDSLKCDSSDTVMTFKLMCKNISIRCDENEVVQIFVIGNEGLLGIIEPSELELKFLVKGRSIYMLMLTPRDKKSKVTSDVLKSVLN